MKKLVSIVAPMYNEEEMAPLFYETISKIMDKIQDQYDTELVLVNDGSKDKTWEILKEFHEKDHRVHAIKFSRNFGHEAAITAGLKYAKGDAVIIMDADLQDPPELIFQMLEKFEEGYEIVNAKRADRKKDGFLKRKTAEEYYEVIYRLSGKIKVPKNVGNYRLMSKRVVEAVNALPEHNRVFRVLVPFVGYKTTELEYVRPARPKGETKYNYNSMFKLAGDSIVSSSLVPLSWAFKLSLDLIAISVLALITTLVFYILGRCGIDPFIFWDTGLYLILSFISLGFSLCLFFIGILSQYQARTFVEAQQRPLFIVEEDLENK